MTDKQALLNYRIDQARDTLADAEMMLKGGVSARSVINRAYYAMFYSIMALFIHAGTAQKTSKHSGVISLFDKEFVHPGTIDRRYSKMMHKMFDARQESEYRELTKVSHEEAVESVRIAQEFFEEMRKFIEK